VRGILVGFEREELIAVASVNVVGRVLWLLHINIVNATSL
jgi:hypothetical protein